MAESTRYGMASLCALLLDMFVMSILVHYFSWWYVAAATASFICGLGVAYWLSVKFVFSERRLANRSAEFAGFAALGALGLGVNAGVIFTAVNGFGVNLLLAKGAAACSTFLCNFFSRRQLLFRR